jgi:hypothetical protein
MELIGGKTTNTHLQTSIAQSNHGSRGTSPAIQLYQDVHVCGPTCVVIVANGDDDRCT